MPTDPTYPYSAEDIRRYLSGSMSPAEMHEMEKAALDDPLLADALDGYRHATASVTDTHLNEIRSRISGHAVGARQPSPVAALQSTKWWRGLAAAAVIGIMVTAAWFFMRPDASTPSPIAGNTPPVAAPAPQLSADTAAQHSKPKDHTIDLQQLPASVENRNVSRPVVASKKRNSRLIAAPAPQGVTADKIADDAPVVTALAATRSAGTPPQANALTANAPIRIRGMNTTAKATPPQKEIGFVMVNNQEPYYFGKVTDKSGNPIPGATITAPQNHSTISNVDGSFRLPAQDSAGNLAFAAPGYEYKMEQLLAGKVAGIQLNQADSSLNDVVVLGYGQQKKRAFTGTGSSYKVDTLPYKESPYPQGGWDSFYNNLTSEMGVDKLNASKELHLRFTVENGLPEKFTVIKTPDEATAQKAISIIKKGPKWKTSKRKKKVDVKMKVD